MIVYRICSRFLFCFVFPSVYIFCQMEDNQNHQDHNFQAGTLLLIPAKMTGTVIKCNTLQHCKKDKSFHVVSIQQRMFLLENFGNRKESTLPLEPQPVLQDPYMMAKAFSPQSTPWTGHHGSCDNFLHSNSNFPHKLSSGIINKVASPVCAKYQSLITNDSPFRHLLFLLEKYTFIDLQFLDLRALQPFVPYLPHATSMSCASEPLSLSSQVFSQPQQLPVLCEQLQNL